MWLKGIHAAIYRHLYLRTSVVVVRRAMYLGRRMLSFYHTVETTLTTI